MSAPRGHQVTDGDDALTWRLELRQVRRWVTPARIALIPLVVALILGIAASARSIVTGIRDDLALARDGLDLARADLREAVSQVAQDGRAPTPTGSDVALARWCLRQATRPAPGRGIE